eukprot:4376328-Ditylum_brightwellii.AAC.1
MTEAARLKSNLHKCAPCLRAAKSASGVVLQMPWDCRSRIWQVSAVLLGDEDKVAVHKGWNRAVVVVALNLQYLPGCHKKKKSRRGRWMIDLLQ